MELFGNFLGPQTDSNPLTGLNELEYGRRQRNHRVFLNKRGSAMKHHSSPDTGRTTLLEVCLPGLEEIPGTH